jgi:hypothetical protein
LRILTCTYGKLLFEFVYLTLGSNAKLAYFAGIRVY